MSFEHPAFSFDQRQPPTPTRTPTSPSFTDVFKTPKFESSFYDPRVNWNTADPGVGSPNILKTPKPLSFGSNNGSFTIESEFLANAQQLLATPDFSALPVGSSFGSEPKEGNNSQSISQSTLALDTNFEPSSTIQTPPPTTTSATKRQGKKAQVLQTSKEQASPSGRRKSIPILPKPAGSGNAGAGNGNAPLGASPGELDFSPAQFGWDTATAALPATAPAYPQQKLFWEPDANNTMNMDMSGMSFNTQRAGLEAFVSTHPAIQSSQRTITDDLDFGDDHTPMQSFNHGAYDFDGQQMIQGLHGVDPSLLSSSPGRSGSLNDDTFMEDPTQAYAYQLQEARREKVWGTAGKLKKRRKPSVDSPAVRAAMEKLREDAPRPSLQRSMTDTALPRLAHESIVSRTMSAHGRSSPLKAIRESKKKHHRTSIALTIDEHGRARAEARPTQSEDMDIDSGSESSCTGNSVDDISDDMIASFASQRGPRIGQFGRASNHSQKSSSSTFYSTSSQQDTHRRAMSMGGAQFQPVIPEDESEAETVLDSDTGEDHAQHQLRRAMQNRQHRAMGRNPYPPHGNSTGFFTDGYPDNQSPSTIPDPELPTPFNSNSPSHVNIRCVCNTGIDNGQMIQCESCQKWLHVACAGSVQGRLPKVYLCLFCTGNTPVARGGRVREPSRKLQHNAVAWPSSQKQSRRR